MNGRRTIVRGGLVLNPTGQVAPKDLLIEDGRILAIDNPGFDVAEDAKTLSAEDRMLIPA
jgi:dihydroorotase-like cyclic amidohydrolase